MTAKRKVQLVLLFSLSLSVVGVTLFRVPNIIKHHGSQQYRSLLASIEILFAVASANALVLGSFVRDRGVKKQKFRRSSVAESFDRTSSNPRHPVLQRHWGSDEDLVRDVGMNIDPELRQQPGNYGELGPTQYTPAPIASRIDQDVDRWQFPHRHRSNADYSDDSLLTHDKLTKTRSEPMGAPRRVSFFDVGGLLDGPRASSGSYRPASYTSSSNTDTQAHSLPAPSLPASSSGFRRGSTALLQDLGGLLGPLNTRQARSSIKHETELQTIPQSHQEPTFSTSGQQEVQLMDAGGLLK